MLSRKKALAGKQTSREKIVAAAIDCLLRAAPSQVTMEDIAAQAGVDRKTIYRTFTNRTALLDEIVVERVLELASNVKSVVDSCDTLDSAIVKGSIHSVALMRGDKVFMAIVDGEDGRGVEQYCIDPASAILKPMLSIWHGVFSIARAKGELRSDLGDIELANWLRGVQLILLLREDLTTSGQASLLRKFVLPALHSSNGRNVAAKPSKRSSR